MSFKERILSYAAGAFSDEDVTHATGLSVRAWRELIKLGAVKTITEGRGPGKVRLYDEGTLKRAAIIAALNDAGFSLAMSAKLAFFIPIDELFFTVFDPLVSLFKTWQPRDPDTGLWPSVDQVKYHGYDKGKQPQATKFDQTIAIYDGRFVGLVSGPKHMFVYGELKEKGTRFVSWYPFHADFTITAATDEIKEKLLPYEVGTPVPKWESPSPTSNRLDPDFLNYEFEEHDEESDPLRQLAEFTARNPVFVSRINVTLAMVRAIRRYLHLDDADPAS